MAPYSYCSRCVLIWEFFGRITIIIISASFCHGLMSYGVAVTYFVLPEYIKALLAV